MPNIMAVSDISTILNENDDTVYNIEGYSNDKKISAECPLDAEFLPEKGDIIQYAVNKKMK